MTEPVTIQVQSTLEWRSYRSDSTGRWIGECAALNLAMEAESLDELHSLIAEAIQLLLTDLLADDELERYLAERGWQAVNMPNFRPQDGVEFNVPWELIAEGARGPERRPH